MSRFNIVSVALIALASIFMLYDVGPIPSLYDCHFQSHKKHLDVQLYANNSMQALDILSDITRNTQFYGLGLSYCVQVKE